MLQYAKGLKGISNYFNIFLRPKIGNILHISALSDMLVCFRKKF